MNGPLANLHLVLMHWPMVNKLGDRIATATTNLDIHDIGRLATTYGVGGYWIVQPMAAQREMVQRIIDHWVTGPGSRLHPDRPRALARVRAVADLAEIAAAVGPSEWIMTTANPPGPTLAPAALGRRLAAGAEPVAVCFGTGWGIAPEAIAAADAILDPIRIGDYYHLSVRSAAAIYVDRIWQGATA